MLFQLCISVDPSLGRLDYASLSDQTRMEIMFSELKEPLHWAIHDHNFEVRDACDWTGVKCDSDGNVTYFKFDTFAEPDPQ